MTVFFISCENNTVTQVIPDDQDNSALNNPTDLKSVQIDKSEAVEKTKNLVLSSSKTEEELITLYIHRDTSMSGFLVNLNLYFNGVKIASMHRNSRTTCIIPSGIYRVHVDRKALLVTQELKSMGFEDDGLFFELLPGKDYYFGFTNPSLVLPGYVDGTDNMYYFAEDYWEGAGAPTILRYMKEDDAKKELTDDMDVVNCLVNY